MYPGAVFYGLLFNVSLMIDSIIAGQFLGASGIAAVALGVPGYGVLAAIIYALIHGSGLRMIWAKGRSNDSEFQRAFNGSATLVGLFGILFVILIFAFADTIVFFCGGDMVDSVIFNNAVIYLKFCSPIVFLTALGMMLQEVMNVMGFQTARATLGAVNVLVNLIVSILCVSIFPTDIKLAGLGIGTSAGGLAEFIVGIILLKKMKIHIEYRPLILQFKEVVETIRCGFPAAADYFAENIVMGIQNNLVLKSFPGDEMLLSTVEVVCNISYFASGTIKGAAVATEPLFGVFYEEKDVKSIKKVWQQGFVLGMVMSIVLAIIFYISLPVLSSLCGMELSYDISRGIMFCMIFAPVMHTVYMFTLYYEATKRFKLSMAFAIIPDSCLYVIMMMILIPILRKDGIWLAITGNQLVGLIMLLPVVFFIGKRFGKGLDRVLLLPREFYDGTLLTESELKDDVKDISAELEVLRQPLNSILLNVSRSEDIMHTVKVIVTDMHEKSKNIHIKLRSGKEKTEIFVRSVGHYWYDTTKIAENGVGACGGDASISYSYVYNMNIIRITLNALRESDV